MKKFMILGCLLLLGATASTRKIMHRVPNNQELLPSALDSLNEASLRLESSAQHLNNSLLKVK